MTRRHFIETSVIIFGCYFMVLAIQNCRDVITYLSATVFYDGGFKDLLDGIFITSVQLIINVIAGVYVIANAKNISQKFDAAQGEKLSFGLRKVDIIEVALIVIAVIGITSSIPRILHKVTHFLYFNDYEKHEKTRFWTGQEKAIILYWIFVLAVGIFLVFNARYFAKKIVRIEDKDDEQDLQSKHR